MYTITKQQYKNTHKDFKGVYTSDNIHGTNFDGCKTIMYFEQGKGTCLLIEGKSFIIVKTEKENINPIRKK